MYEPHQWYELGLLRSPGWVRLALEMRAGWEYGASIAATPLLSLAPRGDGHPVLVFPGLITGDLSTLPLRNYLSSRGYATYPWGLGINRGPRDGIMDACLDRLDTLSQEHGRSLSLIGWSLGGLYARELAKARPDVVRQVITMGTPFTGHPKATNAWRIYEWATGHKIGAPDIHEPLRSPPPVPTTSIFSRSDGVVAWQCSLERESPHTDNIEVQASHLGMGLNPLTLYALADRLAQAEGDWRPFDRSGFRSYLYPDPRRRARY